MNKAHSHVTMAIKNAMLATNKQIHDNNRIEYKQNNIAQTLKPYLRSINILHSPVTMAITKTRCWLQTKYVEPYPRRVVQIART